MKVLTESGFKGNARFEVRRPLGVGAFGAVYEVFDRHYGAVVALKVLQQQQPALVYRFKREFRLLSNLVHPNLVTLHELHAEGAQWFFTMEYVDGRPFVSYVRESSIVSSRGVSLTEHTATIDESTASVLLPEGVESQDGSPPASGPVHPSGPLPVFKGEPERIRAAFHDLAQGVRALHAVGIIHRDLKPSNVLVTSTGRVVVLDFGLAKELAPSSAEAAPEGLAGSPAYMSPEQWDGTPPSEASDWYSFGVMLHEALTGKRPFQGSSSERLRQQRQGPPPLREQVQGLPPNLEDLCVRLLDPDPGKRPPGEELLARLAPNAGELRRIAPAGSSSGARRVVGRELELVALEDAFRLSATGKQICVSLHGKPGMGKSALLRSFIESLQGGGAAIALLGRCHERETVPYKALDNLMDALARHLLQLPREEARRLIPSQAQALGLLFPVLRLHPDLVPASREEADAPEPLQARRRAVGVLKELFRRLAIHRPLAIGLDDLQWGDVDSARLLAELLSPPAAPPVLLIASYRSGEAEKSPFLGELRRLMERSWTVPPRELEVGPLSLETSTGIALQWLGSAARAEAERVARESEGSPFFLEELIREQGAAAGPLAPAPRGGTSLAGLLERRIQGLPAGARHLLEVLAVSGRPVEEELALEAARVGDAALPSLALLRAHRLLRGRPGERAEVEVSHDRIRESALALLGAESLAGHHRRLAEVIEARPDADPEVLANHLYGAGEKRRAGVYAFRAAERANRALAFHRAAELFRTALEWSGGEADPALPGARALRLARADALANAGRGAEAAPLLLELAEEGAADDWLDLRRRAMEQLLVTGRIDEGLALLPPLLERLRLSYPRSNAAALAHLLCEMLRLQLRGLKLRERPAPPSREALIRVDTCWALGKALANAEGLRAAGFQLQSLRLALDAGEPARAARALILFGPMWLWQGTPGSVEKGTRYLEQGTALAHQVQQPALIGFAQVYAGAREIVLGNWDAALAAVDSGTLLLQRHGVDVIWELTIARTMASIILDNTGRMRELAERTSEWYRHSVEVGDRFGAITALLTWAFPRIAADDAEGARTLLRETIASWSRLGIVQHGYAARLEAHADLYEGKPLDAWERLRGIWPALTRQQMLRAQSGRLDMYALRARTALARAEVEAGRRTELLRQAEQDARRLERELRRDAQPMARLLRAGAARIQGRTEEALAQLSAAIQGYDTARMAVHAACARLWKGELVGGDEGAALVSQAQATMGGEGIQHPRRWAAMLVPGFER